MQETRAKAYVEVWQLIQSLKRFKVKSSIESNDAAPGNDLYEVARKLRSCLYASANTDSHYCFLQSIPALTVLTTDIEMVIKGIEEKLGSAQDEVNPAKIGGPLYFQLQEFIGKLEAEFEQLAVSQHLFIGPSRASQYEFFTLGIIKGNEHDKRIFSHLPRLAQSYLTDAGKCLTYGMPGASVGLALRAVETTLRYCFHRLLPDEESGRPWGPMLRAINERNQSLSQHCFERLNRLGVHYRNPIAHGRALLETGKQDVQLGAEEIFKECWLAIRTLGDETFSKTELTVRLHMHSQFDFDAAVAAYLFSWNPEYPANFEDLEDGTLRNIHFIETIAQDELHDVTLCSDGILRAQLGADTKKPLCRLVLEHMHVKDNFSSTIEPLTTFVLARKTGQRISSFDSLHPRATDVDLFDLFEGLRHTEVPAQKVPTSGSDTIEVYNPIFLKDRPYSLLAKTWRMLDLYVAKGAPVVSSNLVADLDQQTAYQAFCRYRADA